MSQDEIPITKHARKRFKERTKLPKRAIRRMAAEALEHGAKPHELDGLQREKVRRAVARNPGRGPIIYRVHKGFGFLFTAEKKALITVIPGFDPEAAREEAQAEQRERRRKHERDARMFARNRTARKPIPTKL